jgi:hypothetical protein
MARKTDEKPGTSRRGFFRTGLLGASAASALVVVERMTGAEAQQPTQRSAGYRETEHVKKVYALARF